MFCQNFRTAVSQMHFVELCVSRNVFMIPLLSKIFLLKL